MQASTVLLVLSNHWCTADTCT